MKINSSGTAHCGALLNSARSRWSTACMRYARPHASSAQRSLPPARPSEHAASRSRFWRKAGRATAPRR